MNQNQVKQLLAKATPGPWMVYDSCSYRRIGTDGPYNELIYAARYSDGQLSLEGERADMELAAAAPQLAQAYLEACAALQQILEWNGDLVDEHAGEPNPREIAANALQKAS